MKILVINKKNNDLKFANLVCHTLGATSKLYPEITTGFVNGSISDEEITNFAPSIIIHNDDYGVYSRYLNIFIRTGNSVINTLRFDGDKTGTRAFNVNDMEPFITLHKENFYDERYLCDASYVGRSSEISRFIKPFNDKGMRFKIFGLNDFKISNFCGSTFNLYKTFKMSRVSFVKDTQSLYDCVYNDGKPILFDEKTRLPEFNCPLELYTTDGIKSKEELINNDTNFDRLSKILRDSGLTFLSTIVASSKKEFIR